MKKRIAFGVILAMLLTPIIVVADTGGSASATLTLTAVINTIVDGTGWTGIELDQNSGPLHIAGLGGVSAPLEWSSTDPEITVTVQALTTWKVWASYSAVIEDASSAPYVSTDYLGDEDAFLYIDGDTTPQVALQYEAIVGPESYTGPYGALTDTGFSGGNNLASNGTTEDFNVLWDPREITDADAGDTLDLTIYFVVEDTSI